MSLVDVGINEGWEKHGMQFTVTKTTIDRASALLFVSDSLSRLVLDSRLTPAVYKAVRLLRSSEEKEVAGREREQ